jgi:hypothetical protein
MNEIAVLLMGDCAETVNNRVCASETQECNSAKQIIVAKRVKIPDKGDLEAAG